MPSTIYPIWEVDLLIVGPVTLAGTLSLQQLKGHQSIGLFYSDIEMRPTSAGTAVTLTANASSAELAVSVGFVFFGQMLDTLELSINQPTQLIGVGDAQRILSRDSQDVRRRIDRHEWEQAFETTRQLSDVHPVFLRALGWYRKAAYTEEPFDAFLAYWNAIEIVACKYHPDVPTDRKEATKSFVWECFKSMWSECEKWPYIAGNNSWIDDSYKIRVDVAHGLVNVDVKAIEGVVSRLPTIRCVAHRFLQDWYNRRLSFQKP